MTAEEIEAIAGGYHGDAFRILGPHSVRKRRGQPCWEVRAFLPQAESAEVLHRRRRLSDGEEARRRILLRVAAPAIRRPIACRRSSGTARRWSSKIPIASRPSFPISICTCTPRARFTRATNRWARTWWNAKACPACASPSGRPMPRTSRWPASSTSGTRAAIPCAAATAASGRSSCRGSARARRTSTTSAPASTPTSSSRPTRTLSTARRRRNPLPWWRIWNATSGRTPPGWRRAPAKTG